MGHLLDKTDGLLERLYRLGVLYHLGLVKVNILIVSAATIYSSFVFVS